MIDRLIHQKGRGGKKATFPLRFCLCALCGLVLAAALLLRPEAACAQQADLAGLQKGFRNLPWGTKLAELPDMRRIATGDRAAKSYVLPGDEPVFAGVRVTRILYGFFDGAFYRATLETADEASAIALARTLFTAFGPPAASAEQGFNDVSVWILKDVEIRCPAKDFAGVSKTVIAYRPALLRQEMQGK